jgi:TatD DNase family protein
MIKSVSGQKIISKIPKDKILTETDGPFIIENNTIIKPGQVGTVITYLANKWLLSEDDVIKIIQSNFKCIVESIR